MKRYYQYIISALAMVFTMLGVSSCQDWLTIYPQSQITEESFWEDKNDLQGVQYAAYQQMCSTLYKMVTWGDLRADSYTLNTGDQDVSTSNLFQEIREGRIERDSANSYFDWEGFYKTINFCNKVLQHGDEVLERDKQFTTAEWIQMKAEITGLRALNYFYLLRAFKDIPYSTRVVNTDTQVRKYGATNQLIVLDSLIVDVESVKGKARNRFSSIVDTKCSFTNAAIYALLSDMYLWRASLRHGRAGNLNEEDVVVVTNNKELMGKEIHHTVRGDYQLAIEYADQAMAALVKQNDRDNRAFGEGVAETINYGLTNCYLYKNKFENFANGNPPSLTAFMEIFGGYSEESIFELSYSTSEKREHNLNGTDANGGGGLWSYLAKTHLAVSDGSISLVYNSTDRRFNDSRMWFSCWNQVSGMSQALPGFYLFKWSNGSYAMTNPDSHSCKDIKWSIVTSKSCNFPIYRLSDVMLQKAEAMAILGQGDEAMRYVNAIHRRWYCNDAKDGAQPSEDVTNNYGKAFYDNTNNTLGNAINPGITDKVKNYERAVLNERQVEFLGEGKRWFDLVRYAERHAGGANDDVLDLRAADANADIAAGPDGVKRSEVFPASANELPGTNSGLIGVTAMVNDLMTGEYSNEKRKSLINRLKNRYGLYNLIYYKEIQAAGGLLEQNPVWNKSLYD